MANLREEFPDLAQSTINAVLGAANDNIDEAANMLREIAEEGKRDAQKHNERKISELQTQFTTVPREVIVRVLEQNKYDVDACIVPLFNILAEVQKQEQLSSKKKRQEADKKKREEQTKAQIKQLMDIFQNIPKDIIQTILDENEGDIQETTMQLLGIVSKQEETKKNEQVAKQKERERLAKEQEERMKNIKIEALREKFPDLTPKEVIVALEQTKWDIKDACKNLVAVSADRKKRELKSLFQSETEEDIQEALQSNDWNVAAAAKILTARRESKRVELKKEEKKKPDVQSSIVITRVQQSLLERSIILGKEVEAEINKEEEKRKLAEKERDEEFKRQLEEVLKIQVQNGSNGMPGLVPPLLPKQIDALNQKGPVDEESQQEHKASTKESPIQIPMEHSAPTNTSGLIVSLKASPTRADSGNTLTVDWEVISGISTAYDWIGLFAVDQPNKQYITYEWRGKQDKKGKLTFVAPNEYGVYEFRYFPSKTYEHITMSERIVVGPLVDLVASLDKENKKIKVSWSQKSGNQYRRAWCGLYEQSQTINKNYIAWEYAPTISAEITFDAPVKPAVYEIRFFSYNYVDVCRSNAIVIEGEDKITATVSDRIITVKKNIVTVNPTTDAVWIGIFFTKQTDNKQWRRYKYVYDRTSDETFKAPNTPGTYEVRLFANKTFDCLLKSNSFELESPKN